MEAVFIRFLNMSITASWLVFAIVLLRRFFTKIPKKFIVIMWGFVAVRLICPFSFESVFSLIPSKEAIPVNIMYMDKPVIHTGVPLLNSTVNPILSDSLASNTGESINSIQVIIKMMSIIWIIGMIAMVVYTMIQFHRVYKVVREAMPMKETIWLCDRIASPFVFGVIHPRIFISASMREQDMEYVIAHEKAHIRRLDYLWKVIAFFLLTIYWFCPVFWLAYILFCRDLEYACDEVVLTDRNMTFKKSYAEALLHCSVSQKLITACPLAFGEVSVNKRIQAVLRYEKATRMTRKIAIVVCFCVMLCFLTNPIEAQNGKIDWTYNYIAGAPVHHVVHLYFDFAYTHIVATCNEGELVDLGLDSQPDGKSITYPAGKYVCWFPTNAEAHLGDTVDNATIDFSVYDGEKMLYSGKIEISKIYTDTLGASTQYSVSLVGCDGLYLQYADEKFHNEGGIISEVGK